MRLSPKEKADELVYKFMAIHISWKQSKICVLIAVDEILKAREVSIGGLILDEDYWQEVKEEIEKL